MRSLVRPCSIWSIFLDCRINLVNTIEIHIKSCFHKIMIFIYNIQVQKNKKRNNVFFFTVKWVYTVRKGKGSCLRWQIMYKIEFRTTRHRTIKCQSTVMIRWFYFWYYDKTPISNNILFSIQFYPTNADNFAVLAYFFYVVS